MTKKYTLTVPDDLAEKIDKWKEHFNLSRVFQHAISQAIEDKIGFQQRMEDGEGMDQIIERLKREKYEAEQLYLEKGKKDGEAWAQAASYKDLKHVSSRAFVDHEDMLNINPLQDPILGDYISEIVEDDPKMEATPVQYNEEFRQWMVGWVTAFHEFWGIIEQKLGEKSYQPLGEKITMPRSDFLSSPSDDDIPF